MHVDLLTIATAIGKLLGHKVELIGSGQPELLSGETDFIQSRRPHGLLRLREGDFAIPVAGSGGQRPAALEEEVEVLNRHGDSATGGGKRGSLAACGEVAGTPHRRVPGEDFSGHQRPTGPQEDVW